MTQEEITTGNKLIAEFMGSVGDLHWLPQYSQPGMNDQFRDDELKFHSSWDWLMPIVERIETMGFDVKIKGISCSINRLCEDKAISILVCGDRSQKLKTIYSTIVKFIEWYNLNK